MAESLKSQREEILDLKLFYEKIIDNSPSAIIICDDIGGVITINTAAEQMFQLSLDDIKGREVFDIINSPPSLKADFYKVIYSGDPTFHESYPLFLANEEERVFRLTIYRIIQRERKSAAIQIEDITESLRLEEELTHAMKLATLGDVLSRFTHEFNNLITGIIGNIQLLKLRTDKDEPGYSRILSIEDLAAKAAKLGENILSFSKKEKLKTERIDTGKMTDAVLELIEKTVLKDVRIDKDYSGGPFYITVNNERFSLALLNLLINANDAVKKAEVPEGHISIKIDREQRKDRKKKYIKIQVSDNGIGIDKKTMDKIFLPYFTTKGKKGTGLGLTTVKQVIDESKGTISVKSKPDEGATFTLKFPESQESK
jgi:PAS domain S-box-containing protein